MTIVQPPLRRTLIALTSTAVLALAGCGGDDEPTPSADPSAAESSTSESPSNTPSQSPSKATSAPEPADEVTVDVTIQGDDVTPVGKAVEIGVGETVVLDITSDRAGELHVHSTPEQELTFEAGSSQVDVTIDKPGSVDIEEHDSGALLVRVLVQ